MLIENYILKYSRRPGKKLKSHIEDLEKRAAVVDQMAKDSNTQARTIVAGDMSSFPTFSTQLGGRGGFASLSTSDNASMSPSQAYEPVGMDIQAPSSSSGPASSFLSHQRKPAQYRQGSMLPRFQSYMVLMPS